MKLRLKTICPKFIAEIDSLIKRADALTHEERIYSSEVFILWKKATSLLLDSMANEGCNLGDGSATRFYHKLPNEGTVEQESAIFEQDITLTVGELKEGKAYFEKRLAEGG